MSYDLSQHLGKNQNHQTHPLIFTYEWFWQGNLIVALAHIIHLKLLFFSEMSFKSDIKVSWRSAAGENQRNRLGLTMSRWLVQRTHSRLCQADVSSYISKNWMVPETLGKQSRLQRRIRKPMRTWVWKCKAVTGAKITDVAICVVTCNLLPFLQSLQDDSLSPKYWKDTICLQFTLAE